MTFLLRSKTVGAKAAEVVEHIVHESESEAHQIFRQYPSHGDKAQKHSHPMPAISHPGSTGVLYVSERAASNGFYYGAPGWANLGQGAPEVGHIPGAVDKPKTIDLESFGEGVHEYAPCTGTKEFRKAVADYYNQTYRTNQPKKYGPQNVCVVPGGRAGLSRVASVISEVMCGYQLPEYTAYENCLGVFRNLIPIPTHLKASDNYKLSIDGLREEIRNRGLSAVVMSNPRNPTGQQIEGEELKALVQTAVDMHATIVLDEFYSWYQLEGELGRAVSAAEFVEDPDETPVVLIDGLTKNWRCPGWRVCWVVGPEDLITALNECGSFLDGGASHVMQCAALPMLDFDRTVQDRIALQKHFRMKRDHCLKRLSEMGLTVTVPPVATFYIWLDLSTLPGPLSSGLVFHEELLREKCIVTPGIFFDVNPQHRRNIVDSPCEKFVRLSCGPPLAELDLGLDAIERVLKKARDHEKRSSMGRNYRRSSLGGLNNLLAPQGHA
ncbi:unnamed protein product [Tilletia laevis]|uniref:Aminotransferase class I/classII large domain-containing protein n=3 Tax=Tilletia TaxID=13289 RepID=A0A8X7MU06_9BASI|nr:hypothetical protein CF336_g8786 [Tilletia laevis]KAE8200785.1 hypothetical protein CF328_g2864 [Tilletia controversa]KAE8261455.1 hypothetical protein A4X03_0g3238 [Tilletia caries]KAE8203461.1 hypothetical protein CF335_g3012 [Tilletia laevis]KAE8248872.1 hypothetical protein A4X06_0g3485 [Tilletia controversa]